MEALLAECDLDVRFRCWIQSCDSSSCTAADEADRIFVQDTICY